MEKKYLVALLIALFLVSGCVDSVKNAINNFGGIVRGPESTAENYVDHVVSGEMEKAAEMMVTHDLEPYTEVDEGRLSAYQALGRNIPLEIEGVKTSAVSKTPFSKERLENLGAKEGYSVGVSVSIQRDGNEFSIEVPVEVVKAEGSWKVLEP